MTLRGGLVRYPRARVFSEKSDTAYVSDFLLVKREGLGFCEGPGTSPLAGVQSRNRGTVTVGSAVKHSLHRPLIVTFIHSFRSRLTSIGTIPASHAEHLQRGAVRLRICSASACFALAFRL